MRLIKSMCLTASSAKQPAFTVFLYELQHFRSFSTLSQPFCGCSVYCVYTQICYSQLAIYRPSIFIYSYLFLAATWQTLMKAHFISYGSQYPTHMCKRTSLCSQISLYLTSELFASAIKISETMKTTCSFFYNVTLAINAIYK